MAAELADRSDAAVTILPQDLAKPGAGEELRRRLDDLGITVTSIINNAGFASTGAFHEIEAQRLRDEVALDVAAVVDVTPMTTASW